MNKLLLFILVVMLCNTIQGQDLWTTSRPDGHAPIGVMGDHTHNKGEWMFSYRYMQMNMSGLRAGTQVVSQADAHADYMMLPENMIMKMHMAGVMYAITDKLTLMGMVPYISQVMDVHMRNMPEGTTFETSSSSIGDLKVSVLYKFIEGDQERMHFNIGIGLPTGSIDEKGVTPMSAPNEVQLPYPMQIGSGSFSILPGVTYLSQVASWSFGAQAAGNFRLNDNNHEYKLGNEVTGTTWVAYKFSDLLSSSFRLLLSQRGEISGADPLYTNPMMAPTLQTQNTGGTQASAALGLNIYLRNGPFKGFRIGAEYGLPFYQDLNGLQMMSRHSGTIGLQYAL